MKEKVTARNLLERNLSYYCFFGNSNSNSEYFNDNAKCNECKFYITQEYRNYSDRVNKINLHAMEIHFYRVLYVLLYGLFYV